AAKHPRLLLSGSAKNSATVGSTTPWNHSKAGSVLVTQALQNRFILEGITFLSAFVPWYFFWPTASLLLSMPFPPMEAGAHA
ncbi:hypothetical protein, partial [Gluconacetobacter aggeris]|uniref:hypothetical protein n=1 Tax=Gluconacetobacter aggeris TaxID=1286186 RepID=UPI001C80E551